MKNIIIIVLGVISTIILAFSSYNARSFFTKILFWIALFTTVFIIISTGYDNFKSTKTLNTLNKQNDVKLLINKAIADGDRESYLHLIDIVENFGANRNIAIAGVREIKTQLSIMTTIKDLSLPKDESLYTTKELIHILFFNSQYLFRARSAQLLSNRRENYVPQALILSAFSDRNLEVVREATLAFCKITGFKSSDFFQPYHIWGYWLDSSKRIKKEMSQVADINVIPWKGFADKLKTGIGDSEYRYMSYWWATTLDIMNQFLIDELNNRSKALYDKKKM